MEVIIIWAFIPHQTTVCAAAFLKEGPPLNFWGEWCSRDMQKRKFLYIWCSVNLWHHKLQLLSQVAKATHCDFCLVSSSLLKWFFFHISNSQILLVLKQPVTGFFSLLVSVFKLAFSGSKLNRHVFWGFSLLLFQSNTRCCTLIVFPDYLNNFTDFKFFSNSSFFQFLQKSRNETQLIQPIEGSSICHLFHCILLHNPGSVGKKTWDIFNTLRGFFSLNLIFLVFWFDELHYRMFQQIFETDNPSEDLPLWFCKARGRSKYLTEWICHTTDYVRISSLLTFY